MNAKQASAPPPAGLALDDIYHVVFRRKWLILAFALIGFAGAATTYFVWKPDYMSIAKIFVAYVVDPGPTDQSQAAAERPDRGAMILGSELEILKNYDLAKKVAEVIGPGRILGDSKNATNMDYLDQAAGLVYKNMTVDVPKNSQVIEVTFSHPEPAICRQVLDELITNYFDLHTEIHQRTEMITASLKEQTALLKSRVENWDTEMAKVQNDTGFVDINEKMKALSTQGTIIQQDLNLTQANLDEAQARAARLKSMIPEAVVETNAASTTNVAKGPPPPTAAQQEAYTRIRGDLQKLQEKEAALDTIYTTNDARVVANLAEIAATKAKIKDMETEAPGLIVVAAIAEAKLPAGSSQHLGMDPREAYNDEMTKIVGWQAKIARDQDELNLCTTNNTSLVAIESKYKAMERDRSADEDLLKNLERKYVQLDIESHYGPGLSGLRITQHPTPAGRDTKKVMNAAAAMAGGGLAFGLALAFLLEMVLDRSFKRPQEIVSKLNFPFFLSVPYLNGQTRRLLGKPGKDLKRLPPAGDAPQPGSSGAVALPAANGDMPPWDEKHALRPFHETLRDRLINHFEVIGLTHKPKLVALTSCHHGAGVSTMAAGLASSLSETGDGNVLLVNMNSDEGDAHQFYKGKLTVGLDDFLDKNGRESALVHENLYVVQESSNRDKLPAIMPKRFSKLVGKLKASDYDYIIFDMPPVTQISVTPRLARFMDMVLLVVESEKTDKEVAARVSALLSESRANVGTVMNKQRSYVPKQLHQDF